MANKDKKNLIRFLDILEQQQNTPTITWFYFKIHKKIIVFFITCNS